MDEKHISQPNKKGSMGIYGRPHRYNQDMLPGNSAQRIYVKDTDQKKGRSDKVRKDIIAIKQARKRLVEI